MITKLEAVNRCLQAIGESRVNSLSAGVPDADEAASIIDEVAHEIQAIGWTFNTQNSVTLTPTSDKTITVGPSVLRIDTVGRSSHLNVTVRENSSGQRKLFNVNDDTYEFVGSVEVMMIRTFEFGSLPYDLSNYIAARATRVFQERVMGSVSLDSFASRSEQEAWLRLMDAEAEAGDYNTLTHSPYVASITQRNAPYSWR